MITLAPTWEGRMEQVISGELSFEEARQIALDLAEILERHEITDRYGNAPWSMVVDVCVKGVYRRIALHGGDSKSEILFGMAYSSALLRYGRFADGTESP